MKRFLLSATLLLGAFLPLAGQNARLYQPETGLPNSQVNRIYQDRSDYIWICTEGGLVRFDGMRFETYQHDRESENCLSSSSVIDMVEDGRGTKWIGTAAGLDILDSEYSSFTHFDLHRNPETPVNPYIGRLLEVQANGTVIVGTGGAGVFVIDSETRQELPERREIINRTLRTEYIHTLFLDASGRLWILPGDSRPVILDAISLEPAEGLAWSPELEKAGDLLRVNDMAEDPVTGDILLGSTEGLLICKAGSGVIRKVSGRRAATTVAASTIFDTQAASGEERLFLIGNEDGGLLHFDSETEEVRTAVVSSIRQETGNWKATSSLRDAQGNLWLGLYQTGVLVAPKSRFGFAYQGFSTRGMPGENNTVVTSVFEDGQNLWVATDGGGLFCRPVTGGRRRQAERVFTRDNSALNNNAILAVTGDRYGTIWLGTYLGGLYYIEGGTTLKPYPYGDQLGTDRIRTIVYDPARDLLYVGTSGAGLAVIDAKTHRLAARQVDEDYRWISALHLDQTGRLWVGSYNGPFCYDPSLDRITPFSGTAGNDLPPRIYDICSSADGSVWFGTEEGLFQWNESTRELRRFTQQDGLSNNVIRAILNADGGDMWVSTSSGLNRLSPRTGKVTVFQSYDGLQGNEFRTGCAFKAPSGRLYFGGNGGLTSFSPLLVDSGGDRMPQVALARLTMLDQPVVYDPAKGSNNLIDKHISEATRIRIPRGADMFSLEFSVPEYTNPQRLMFDYRLSGFESDWKTAPARLRMATYTNVPPGRYRFEVKAYFAGSPEVFSERSVDIRVEAPWYLTGWAWAVYLLILTGMVLTLLHLARQRRRQEEQKKEAELKELRLGLFTNLTHEIRTPLNLVMSPLGAIREAEQDPVRKDTYNLMYRNCLRINRIVNQLMDLRKIDAGQMQLFFRETDLVYFIRDIMQSFGKLAESKRIDFSLTSAHPEETLWIDQGNFDKIVYNILSNAFKHTPDGGRIHVDVSAPTPNRGDLQADVREFVQVRIFNSGSRIEEAWISHVFDRFVQVNPHDANSGSGVGLNLTKMLVELHHGHISAENEDDGVVFRVLVPVGKDHLTEQELSYTSHHKDLYIKSPSALEHEDQTFTQEEAPAEKAARARKSVVVVDDDDDTREYLRNLLRNRYNVTACPDAKSAWDAVSETLPDAVVTDLVMPGESGSDLCARIRANDATRHIPVLILTGQNGVEEQQAASDSGADKFLSKPISVELLLSSIAQVISSREAVKEKFGVALKYDYTGIQMGSADDKLLHRIVESIQAHLDDPDYGVASLCEDVGISRVHLNRKLKAFGKDSPGVLIKTFRMKQAAYLLANNKVNVSEVAYRVGFSSHSYFSNAFREYFGMSPREFVTRIQENPDDASLKQMFE
jgi:signal transduction histidine kinase/ligand-binding sensor domain-containing protein/CheY-like chemotaxis protein/AraC-like DNA-binding protein